MQPSGRGQRSGLVRRSGLMNLLRIAVKSRLAAVTFARELYCLNRAGAMLNITSQWQEPEILIFLLEYLTRN